MCGEYVHGRVQAYDRTTKTGQPSTPSLWAIAEGAYHISEPQEFTFTIAEEEA
jgi:hypothetical protein